MRIFPHSNGLSPCGVLGPSGLSPSGLLSCLIDTANAGPTAICSQRSDQVSLVRTAKTSEWSKKGGGR